MASTLPRVLIDAAARHPERPLLRFEGGAWTYAEFADLVRAAARSLRAWGLEPGERVALYLGNSPSFLVAYLAVLACGAIVVPVNARYREGELRHVLDDAEARLLITDAEGAAVASRAQPSAPALAGILVLDGRPELDAQSWRAFGGDGATPPEPSADDGDALALIAYTSGTTGRSKGATLSHAQLLAGARAVGRAWRWTAEDRLLLTLPLFHIHGLGVGFHGALVHGASVDLRRRFDAAEVLTSLERGDATLFFGVPTMYARLVAEAGDRRVASPDLRLLVSGSAPLAAAMHARIERVFGLRVLERYGMSETVMLTGNPLEGPRKPGSVGVPFDGVELRLTDPATADPVAEGAVGEVVVRGPSVTRGYWRNPDATRAAFTADGWFRTGDLGVLDGDGFLTLTGRAHDLIITGGFNVYPREVEERIAGLPGVREVAVVGLADADLGERVVAAIVADDPSPATASAVLEACRRHLAGFKAPKEVRFLDALPRNAMGKLLRHELRDALSRSP